MGSQVNKQFLCLSGLPILLHTLRAFEVLPVINDIIIVAAPGEEDFCQNHIIQENGLVKVRRVVTGGKERQQSVYNGLQAVDSETDLVLVHDGARPLLDEATILRVIEAARRYGAATCGVPVKDTIKAVDEQGLVTATLERTQLWSIQTPQGFRREVLWEAHESALRKELAGTDDAMLVESIGQPVKVVMGSYDNIKVTTPEDLIVAEAIMAGRKGY